MASKSMLKAVTADHKKRLGSGNLKVLKGDWSVLSYWNAHLVIHEHKELLDKDKKDAEMVRDGWTKRIVGEMIRKSSVNQFRVGEESTNFPKISAQEYKRGITVEKITEILMNHREALSEWKKNKAKKEKMAKEQKAERAAKQAAEERAAAEPAEEEVSERTATLLEIAEVDDWEDLDLDF